MYNVYSEKTIKGYLDSNSYLTFRTEQNRTVSLLISGHIHDIEIQCEQQNVIYKGLGIFFSSKYKAVIQIWYVGLLSFISQRSVNR